MRENLTAYQICEKMKDLLEENDCHPVLDAEELRVICNINGIKFAAHVPDDAVFGFPWLWYSCEFDLGRKLSGEEKKVIEKLFDEEEPVIFENLHFSEEGVLLTTILPADLLDGEFIGEVISSLCQTGALLDYLKANSIKREEAENVGFRKVIESAENRLCALGYAPERSADSQLDCIINGASFAIYGSELEKTFGFGCVFEPKADRYADGFFEGLKANFEGGYGPFQYLLMCDDGTIHLEGECDAYTDRLIDDVVNALCAQNHVASAIKSESYVWGDN